VPLYVRPQELEQQAIDAIDARQLLETQIHNMRQKATTATSTVWIKRNLVNALDYLLVSILKLGSSTRFGD
jgi:hypothetical protein